MSTINSNESFTNFVKKNRDYLKSRLFQKLINKEFNSSIEVIDPKIVNKWVTYVVSKFKFTLEQNFIERMCLYFELYEQYVKNPPFGETLLYPRLEKLMHFDLENSICIEYIKKLILKLGRSKIIGKVYNYSNNSLEYQLEDGNYIPVSGGKNIMMIPDSFLPVEVLILTDLNMYRDSIISEII